MELLKLVKYDAQTYITAINVVKNFVIYSDIQKSVHFLRFVVRVARSVCPGCQLAPCHGVSMHPRGIQ
jgi:hypothetical protein